MEEKSLLSYLSQIADFRIKKGQRHVLYHVLGMTIMATLSGRRSIKGISRFILSNSSELIGLFGCKKQGVPSYGTLRTILTKVAFDDLNKALFAWINYHAPFAEVDFASADGKALCSTISNANNESQNYIYLVSIYGTLNQLIYSSSCNETQKDNEVAVVREMFTKISTEYEVDSTAVGGRFDALYCQKK
jgi:DDE_Tnp_1-associated